MAFLPVSQTGVVRQMNECLILPYRVRQGLYTILRKNNRTLIKLQKHTLTFPHIVILQFYGKPAIHLPSLLASFPGSSAWAERKEPGTHSLRMLSSPRISGNLEIFCKICSVTLTSARYADFSCIKDACH